MTVRRNLLLACTMALSSCSTAESLRSHNPPADAPAAAAAEQQGVDQTALDELANEIRSGEFGNTHSLLVAHRGELRYEAHFIGHDRAWGEGAGSGWEDGWQRNVRFGPERLHDARSVSKAVVALLVGIAIDQGHLPDINTPLHQLLPNHRPWLEGNQRTLTLRHLLTMSTGLAWREASDGTEGDEQRMYASPDPVAFVLSRDAVSAPGARFLYGGGNTQILATLLESSTGQPIDAYAREQLFAPLGITELEWRGDKDGSIAAASGLRMLPRDFLKLGVLFANGGNWQGRQIVSESWIRDAMASQVTIPVAEDAPAGTVRSGYGFQMWNDVYQSTLGPTEVSTASGLGGQRIFINPENGLVVVVLSGHYGDTTATWIPEEIFLRVVSSLRPRGAGVTQNSRSREAQR